MKTARHRYVASAGRVVLAWLAGGVSGGLLTWIAVCVTFVAADAGRGLNWFSDLAAMAFISVFAAPIAIVAVLAGIALAGGPFWILLHRIGARGPVVAAALGAVLMGLAGALLFGSSVRHESAGWEVVGATFAMAGALTGYAVWRVAYRPAPPPQAVF